MPEHNTHFLQWIIVIVWFIIAIACGLFIFHSKFPFIMGNISDRGTESGLAQKQITKNLSYGNSRVFVLYKSDALTANNLTFSSEVKKSLAGLKNFSLKHKIISPYENPAQISKNKHAAYAVVVMERNDADQVANAMKEFHSVIGKPKNLAMYIGGEPSYISDIYRLSEDTLIRGEFISLPLSIIAMIVIFRGVVAALLPIITGIISIMAIISVLIFIGSYHDLSIFVLNIATMLGLGLTLDYTLLITYRFREELSLGRSSKEAMKITLNTAGKSVFFSGLIVLLSIALLITFPIDVLYSIGIGGIVVVSIAVMSALILLPSMLCLLGHRVNAWPVTLFGPQMSVDNLHENCWYRFSMYVMKHPFLFMLPTIVLLLMLGYPFLNVKLNRSEADILPKSAESRLLIDHFDENFNANEMSPIDILITAKNGSILTAKNISALYDYAQHLKKDKRVDKIQSIVTIDPAISKQQYIMIYRSSRLPFSSFEKQVFHDTTKGKYTVMSVFSKFSVNDESSFDLVKIIRENKIGNHLTKQVTGTTATILDTINSSYKLFLKTMIVISLVTYIVLLVLLRSLVLPLKAIIMNFLSLCVCYGMLVFIFQEGHLSSLLGFKALGNTDLNLPILLFFSLFGLSMDYEVFLMTRIKEFYDRTGDNTRSVALGIERSARIITGAALIIVIVTFAFVTADIVFIKAFALGTALAIIVDVSIIRILLVPATMRLLGKWNWYLPRWLDRIIPDIKLEKHNDFF